MGWAYGIDGNGREIGYSVVAVCDEPDCVARIDRGLAYRCGPLGCETADGEYGCGGYFCGEHLLIGVYGEGVLSPLPGEGWCERCYAEIEEDFAESGSDLGRNNK